MQPAKLFFASKNAAFASVTSAERASTSNALPFVRAALISASNSTARFVQTAAQFASTLRLRNASRPDAPVFDAKSLLGVMQSGIAQGQQAWIGADGPDAVAALEALRLLVEHDFEEV